MNRHEKETGAWLCELASTARGSPDAGFAQHNISFVFYLMSEQNREMEHTTYLGNLPVASSQCVMAGSRHWGHLRTVPRTPPLAQYILILFKFG